MSYIEALRLIQTAARALERGGENISDDEFKIHSWILEAAMRRVKKP